jgi:hypothetical protein
MGASLRSLGVAIKSAYCATIVNQEVGLCRVAYPTRMQDVVDFLRYSLGRVRRSDGERREHTAGATD